VLASQGSPVPRAPLAYPYGSGACAMPYGGGEHPGSMFATPLSNRQLKLLVREVRELTPYPPQCPTFSAKDPL
jgi:hypothetical protein